MKQLAMLLTVAAIMLAVSGVAQAETAYNVDWSAQIGNSSSNYGEAVAADANGCSYVSGYTRGALDGTTASSTSLFVDDAYVAKFNANGSLAWTRQIGSGSGDHSNAVAVDTVGNVYITGYTSGITGSTLGSQDAFVTKYSSNGTLQWTTQVGTVDYDNAKSVTTDTVGNVYICGYTAGSLVGTNQGSYDAFLTKLNADGEVQFSSQIGIVEQDIAYSIAVDASGNMFMAGKTNGSLAATYAGGTDGDVFLTKFNSSGTEQWRQQIGTAETDICYSVALDSSGNAFIAGKTYGSLEEGTTAVGSDAFMAKYKTDGTQLWINQIGTASSTDYGQSVAVDAEGNAFLAGLTWGDMGGENMGVEDAFLLKLDGLDGEQLWAAQIGTSAREYCNGAAVDGNGNVYIGGTTKGDLGGINAGGYDAYVVKYAVPEPATMSLLGLGGLALLRRKRK